MEQHRPATAGGDEKNLSHGVVEESVGGSVAGEKVAGRILDHSHNADAAMKALAEYEGEVLELTEETNKRLLRKIDWHIMPILCLVYMVNFLDKTTISYASIMGLKEPHAQGGIDITSNQYSWLGSMFYFGYLVWEWPTSRLLQYLPLGKYSAFNVVMWGVSLTCFAAANNFAGAMVVRFFLGFFESAVTPGFVLFTSQWYTKSEQGMRTGIWFSFNGVAQIVGGLVAYGIARGTDIHGSSIEPWKILFLATGLFTVSLGIAFFFIMPDNQLNCRWLSEQDRRLAVERIRVNQQGIGNKTWKMYQVKEAFLDPLTWAFFLYSLITSITNGGITNFFSLLITSFGYTSEQSLLYGTPAGAVEIIALVGCGYFGDKLGSRLLVSTSGLIAAIIGVALIIALPESMNVGRLIGYYLTGAAATSFVALLSLVGTNVAGYTKKTTVGALYLIGYCVGNIIGPQTFRGNDYTTAEIIILVCESVAVLIVVFIFFYCKWQNKKKAAIRAAPGYVKLENQEWLDLTDRENPEFVYVL
ncbi:membrane transporter [Phyllosticta capitalensis]|uniref:Membrane transporter n=1 Tax=Phyllosticta capitalensis TaxID=121624 RepID=A0ABR1YDS1_9PEZI